MDSVFVFIELFIYLFTHLYVYLFQGTWPIRCLGDLQQLDGSL